MIKKSQPAGRQGFTLIELLVVISIIGILMAISIIGLAGTRESTRDARRKGDIGLIKSGLELYRADCNSYPTTANFPIAGSSLVGDDTSTTACLSENTYISEIPDDPITDSRDYAYTSDGTTYTLCAGLENDTSAETGCGSCGLGITCSYKVINP